MVSYAPPIDDLAIFDPSVFSSDSDTLTQAQADSRYCLYPNVQGSLNLINASVLGTLDMSNNNITNLNQISCDASENNITTFNRINQDLLVGTDNSSVSGFYSKAKDVFPALQNNATALKAVSTFTYSSNTSLNASGLQAVIWCPYFNKFLILGPGTAWVSDDGMTFTTTAIGSGTIWTGAVYIPEINRVVAIANSGTYRVRYTDDLATWNTPSLLPPVQQLRGITYSPQLKKLVAVAFDGIERVWVSNDYGVTWTTRQVPEQNQWRAVCWCDTLGLFVACSSSTGTYAFMISRNGDNWFPVLGPADNTTSLRNVCFSRTLGIIVGVGTTTATTSKKMIYSYDGLNWFSGNLTGTNINSAVNYIGVAWSPQLKVFVSTGFSNSNITASRWIYSYDGVNWTDVPTSLGTGDGWLSMDWSPELSMFVAVGAPQGTSTMPIRVMKSSLKARLPTANNVFGSTNYNNIDENGDWLINTRNIKVDTRVRLGGNASILSATNGGASGIFLNVNVNGTNYKIQLLNT